MFVTHVCCVCDDWGVPSLRQPCHRLCFCVALQVSIIRNGGVEMIVAAARAHNDSVVVSRYACLALANLAASTAHQVPIYEWAGVCVVRSSAVA